MRLKHYNMGKAEMEKDLLQEQMVRFIIRITIMEKIVVRWSQYRLLKYSRKECLSLSNYLDSMSELLKFPIKAKGLDGYNDWMRDLSWIPIK